MRQQQERLKKNVENREFWFQKYIDEFYSILLLLLSPSSSSSSQTLDTECFFFQYSKAIGQNRHFFVLFILECCCCCCCFVGTNQQKIKKKPYIKSMNKCIYKNKKMFHIFFYNIFVVVCLFVFVTEIEGNPSIHPFMMMMMMMPNKFPLIFFFCAGLFSMCIYVWIVFGLFET